MKKKIMALLMAMVLVFGMTTPTLAAGSATMDNSQLAVEWDSEKPWTVKIENVIGETSGVSYQCSLRKDGKTVMINGILMHIIAASAEEYGDDEFIYWDVSEYITGEGEYDVAIAVYAGGALYGGSTSVKTYETPEESLNAPQDITISEDGIVSFGAVENAASYGMSIRTYDLITDEYVGCYMNDVIITPEEDAEQITFDLAKWFEEDYGMVDRDQNIRVIVRAKSGNIDELNHSAYSEPSNIYELRLSSEEVESNLDEALESEDAAVVKTVLSNTSNETLITMMEDAAFVEKVAEAETVYAEEMNITVSQKSDTDIIDADKVTIVGAALNATEKDQTVALTFAEPEEEVTVPDTYKNAVALNIQLFVDETVMTDLDVPVTITMPVPEGVDTENLVILHYHGDAEEPAVITPVINDDGTMTFSVAGFSTFVFANKVDTTVEDDPENTPEEDPENKPEDDPENTPEEDPENKPEDKPENKPETKPENKPNTTPENTPNTTLGNGGTAPKTGDTPVMAVVMAMLAACAVIFAYRYKKLENK